LEAQAADSLREQDQGSAVRFSAMARELDAAEVSEGPQTDSAAASASPVNPDLDRDTEAQKEEP